MTTIRRVITFEEAQEAREDAFDRLRRQHPEVSGLGITRIGEGWGFKVNLRTEPTRALPGKIHGVPIVSEVVGVVRAG